MISIYEVSLLDLLPPNLKEDPDMVAAAKAIDSDFILVANEVKQCILLPKIDDINDSDVIDLLAWQMHVDFYDYTLPLEKKKNLIKISERLHRVKGTPQAVIDAVSTIFGRTKLKEWFEYNGKPYFFTLDIDITEQGATQENFNKLDTLIKAYKNERSWVEYINVYLTAVGKIIYNTALICGEKITVYPYSPKELESKGKINIAIGENVGVESIEVYPGKE